MIGLVAGIVLGVVAFTLRLGLGLMGMTLRVAFTIAKLLFKVLAALAYGAGRLLGRAVKASRRAHARRAQVSANGVAAKSAARVRAAGGLS